MPQGKKDRPWRPSSPTAKGAQFFGQGQMEGGMGPGPSSQFGPGWFTRGPAQPEEEEGGQPTAHHTPAPVAHHGAGGMGDFASMMLAMMEQYNKMIESFLTAGLEPGASEADGGLGFEDTVLTRRVLPTEAERSSLFALRQPEGPATPGMIVVDPITGTEYASPAAALRAGVTNYTYKAGAAASAVAPAATTAVA